REACSSPTFRQRLRLAISRVGCLVSSLSREACISPTFRQRLPRKSSSRPPYSSACKNRGKLTSNKYYWYYGIKGYVDGDHK
ncbi:hypothetical protein L9F63_003292, partial [Diploptera punctata]